MGSRDRARAGRHNILSIDSSVSQSINYDKVIEGTKYLGHYTQ